MREPLAENTKRVIALLKDNEPDTPTRQALIERILDREEAGLKKYGHTMDRRDYEQRDWRLELLGELLDGPQYAMAAGEIELATYLLNDAYRIQGLLEKDS
jgi:hypothetical protein